MLLITVYFHNQFLFVCFNCSCSYTSKYMYNTVNIHVDVSVFMTSAMKYRVHKFLSMMVPLRHHNCRCELQSYYRSTYWHYGDQSRLGTCPAKPAIPFCAELLCTMAHSSLSSMCAAQMKLSLFSVHCIQPSPLQSKSLLILEFKEHITLCAVCTVH